MVYVYDKGMLSGSAFFRGSVGVLASVMFLLLFEARSHGLPTITREPPETLVDETGVISTLSVEAVGDHLCESSDSRIGF